MASGEVPGNLVASDGVLVTQSSTQARGFRSREWLEQEIASLLKNHPDDPKGLGLQGAWRLQRGDVARALDELQKSVAEEPNPQMQQVLVWSLLDGMRIDFANYRSRAPLIEKCLAGPEQHLQFLRRYAQGLQKVGESAQAFENYLRILERLPWPDVMQDLDSRWAATDSRWVLARLQEILLKPQGTTRQNLHQLFDHWVSTSDDAERLLRILPACPRNWYSAATLLDRLEQVSDPDDALLQQRESLLRPMLQSESASLRARAAALLLATASDHEDLTSINEMLAVLEAQDIQLPMQLLESSRELAEFVREDPAYLSLVQAEPVWTQHVHMAENQPTPMRQALYQIPLLGSPSKALDGWTFFIDPSGSSIELFDPHGRHRSRVPTGFPGLRYASETDLGRYVSMHGHLALIVLVDRFLILDFLRDPSSPELIANRLLSGEEDDAFGARSPLPGLPRPGYRTMLLEQRAGHVVGNVGPLTDSLLCFGNGTTLTAIHPASGQELWQRRDLSPGAEIFGDEEFIITKAPDENRMRLYRALDGSSIGTVTLPTGAVNCLERHNGDWGRYIPVVETKGNRFIWSLYDPAADRSIWTHQAAEKTVWTAVAGRDIAFYSPDQVLSVRQAQSGKEIYRAQVPTDGPVQQLTVLRYPENDVILTSRRPLDLVRREALGVRAHELVLSAVDGTVAAIDRRSGAIRWSTTISRQEVVTQCPFHWPILVFANAAGRIETLILNRFTGKIIHRDESGDDGTGISWLTEIQPLRIQLKCAQARMTLLCEESAPPAEKTDPAPSQKENRLQ
jgi:tetratricopeptide (TPR) repeat protein